MLSPDPVMPNIQPPAAVALDVGCPVAHIAAALEDVIGELDLIDEARAIAAIDPVEAIKMEDRKRTLTHRHQNLERAVTAVLAQSAAGALLQLMFGAGELDVLTANVSGSQEDIAKAEETSRGIEHCIWSAVAFIERHHGVGPEDVVGGYYGRSDLSPFRSPQPRTGSRSGVDAAAHQQIADLVGRYDDLLRFYHAASDEEERARQAGEDASDAKLGIGHAVRQMNEVSAMLYELPARDLLSFGLKARVLAEQNSELWDDDTSLSPHERGIRALLSQLMAAGGVSRIERSDFGPADFGLGEAGGTNADLSAGRGV